MMWSISLGKFRNTRLYLVSQIFFSDNAQPVVGFLILKEKTTQSQETLNSEKASRNCYGEFSKDKEFLEDLMKTKKEYEKGAALFILSAFVQLCFSRRSCL